MNYHDITYPDMKNGSGLRVVLWLSGCSRHCYNCQNPQTWDSNSGITFNQAAHNELIDQLSKNYISGITLTGGDPLHENNIYDVLELINEIRLAYPVKNIWLYSGYTWKEVFDGDNEIRKKIISRCDVMVDGRYIDDLRDLSLKWRGSTNQNVINIQESIKQERLILYCD